MSPERNLELEAAIAADPEARGGYEVYADWLAQRGDPRGELIAVQLAREDRPLDSRLAKRETELLVEHGSTWLGGLDGPSWPGPPIEVEWERGFVISAIISTRSAMHDTANAYRAFAELPSAVLVRALALGIPSYPGGDQVDVSILEALRDRPLPMVRMLALREFEHSTRSTYVGDISIAELGYLDELHISAGQMMLDAIDLPQLRRLRLSSHGLRAQVLASVAAARWPALEELVVYFGTHEDGTCTSGDVLPILAGTNFPRVTSLALCGTPFSEELVAQLVDAPILPRLTSLDLQFGTIGAAGAQVILENAEKFEHLARLDLGDNRIPEGLATELSRRLPHVELLDHRIEDEYGRYTELNE